jgi:hypothetical protein
VSNTKLYISQLTRSRQAREYLPLREQNPEPTIIIGLRTEEDEGADVDPPEAYKFQALQAMQFRGGSMRQCQVFDAGQYVSGMDWCPMSEEDSASKSACEGGISC